MEQCNICKNLRGRIDVTTRGYSGLVSQRKHTDVKYFRRGIGVKSYLIKTSFRDIREEIIRVCDCCQRRYMTYRMLSQAYLGFGSVALYAGGGAVLGIVGVFAVSQLNNQGGKREYFDDLAHQLMVIEDGEGEHVSAVVWPR